MKGFEQCPLSHGSVDSLLFLHCQLILILISTHMTLYYMCVKYTNSAGMDLVQSILLGNHEVLTVAAQEAGQPPLMIY